VFAGAGDDAEAFLVSGAEVAFFEEDLGVADDAVGVRSSWLMLARKALLARVAASALAVATASSAVRWVTRASSRMRSCSARPRRHRTKPDIAASAARP